MNKNIIIDYLNFSSAFRLIKNERGSNVKALFRPKSKKIEFLLIKILSLFRIKYSLDKISLVRPSDNIGNKIIDLTGDIVRSISEEYIYNSSSKINDCLNFNLKSWLFQTLWRQVFIIEYVKRLDINVDSIYIESQVKDDLLMKSSFYQSKLNIGYLIHYKSNSLIDDEGYCHIKKRPLVKYVGNNISMLLEFLFALFFVKFRRKKLITKIDLLVFDHSSLKLLTLDEVYDNLTLDTKVVYPDGMVGSDKDAFQIRSIEWGDFFKFYAHMATGFFRFYWAISINLNLFFKLLTRWKYLYILQSFFKKYDVKIVLSGFEAPINQVATALAADSIGMASFDCLWSIGERPNEFACTQHRMSDRYFLWGMWHHDLMNASNDKSNGHIISGYVGDYNIPLMQSEGKKFRNKQLTKFNKIITVFDSGSAEDLLPKVIYRDFLKIILRTAEEFNALVILKIKNEDRYSEFNQSIHTGRLIIHREKGSLEAALNSDVVIGIVNSGMTSVIAAHGKEVMFYDPNELVWSHWETYVNACPIARTLTDFEATLRGQLSNNISRAIPFAEHIDPYIDGKSQNRMGNYIQNVFDNLYQGKNMAIYLSDNIYKKQWGDDKVIIRKNLNIE